MDILITVVSWMIGLYAAFILLLSIGFAAGGAANTGNKDLGIISLVSSLLLLYLIWTGISSLLPSDEADSSGMTSSVKVAEGKAVKEADYDTTEVDTSGIAAPSIDGKSTAAPVKAASHSHKQAAAKKKELYEEYPYLFWSFYAVAFLLYASWLFKPSKSKGQGKDLVKQKLIATMTWKEDARGLKPWNPQWNPECEDTSTGER